MDEDFEGHSHSEEELDTTHLAKSEQLIEISPKWIEIQQKKPFLDPPRELPNRSYSLEPDMANGWRPKRNCRANFSNVFPINYNSDIVDQIVKELYRLKGDGKDKLIYLGPRKDNSYTLHEERAYSNPYPIDKKMDQIFSARIGLPLRPKLEQSRLTFNSDFESGNLDAVIQRGPNEFDLFMRVDSNTRGHTNWFYFTISNNDFIGSVRFSICNFRREKSLYQRGLKPYVFSKLQDNQWHQGGKKVTYEKMRPRYSFLYEEEDWDEYMYSKINQGKIKHIF